MNPYLELLKMKKGLPRTGSKGTKASYEPFEPAGSSHLQKHVLPYEPYEPTWGRPIPENDLVREFMEVDGLSLEEAQALAAVSVQPRPLVEWLQMIAELDNLIHGYFAANSLAPDAREQIMVARYKQSLASIPASIAFFKKAIGKQP